MKKFTCFLSGLAFTACSISLLASCEVPRPTTTVNLEGTESVEITIAKPYCVIFASEDLEPSNVTNNIKFSLIQDYIGDTLAIYQSGLGGVTVINMSQQRLVNKGLKTQ